MRRKTAENLDCFGRGSSLWRFPEFRHPDAFPSLDIGFCFRWAWVAGRTDEPRCWFGRTACAVHHGMFAERHSPARLAFAGGEPAIQIRECQHKRGNVRSAVNKS